MYIQHDHYLGMDREYTYMLKLSVSLLMQVHQPMVVCKSVTVSELLVHFSINHLLTFNGPLSGTTLVSQYQKTKTNLDFTEARDSEWQWHQLGHMQVIICGQFCGKLKSVLFGWAYSSKVPLRMLL